MTMRRSPHKAHAACVPSAAGPAAVRERPSTVEPAGEELPAVPDLDSPTLFFNRELSLLAFQQRVLDEAKDAANPLLERVNFLSILGSNLDEFFMVRVAVLKQKLASSVAEKSGDGRTGQVLLDAITAMVTGVE